MCDRNEKTGGGCRENQYDALRILSTIAVVVIHANWFYFSSKYDAPDGSFEWIVESLLNILTRFSVPCFVMISGAFNLNKEVNALDFYKKTSLKIFLPAAVIEALCVPYRVFTNVLLGRSPLYELKTILSGHFFNFWFVYMLAILYLLTPAIILIKKRCSWHQYKLIAIIWIILAVVSQATSTQKLAYSIGVGGAFVAYYIVGDIISTEIKNIKPKKLVLIALCFVSIAISYFWRRTGHNYYISNAFTNFFSPTVLFFSLCIFGLFGSMNFKKDVSVISGRMFYLYLFHTLILDILERLFGDLLPDFSGIVVLSLMTVTMAYLLSIVFDFVWKRIGKALNLKSKWYGMRIWRPLE